MTRITNFHRPSSYVGHLAAHHPSTKAPVFSGNSHLSPVIEERKNLAQRILSDQKRFPQDQQVFLGTSYLIVKPGRTIKLSVPIPETDQFQSFADKIRNELADRAAKDGGYPERIRNGVIPVSHTLVATFDAKTGQIEEVNPENTIETSLGPLIIRDQPIPADGPLRTSLEGLINDGLKQFLAPNADLF